MKGYFTSFTFSLLIIISLLLSSTFCSSDKGDTINPTSIDDSSGVCNLQDDVEKVLLIGASYFLSLPNDLTALATSQNKQLLLDGIIVSGALLDYHASNQATKDRINSMKWDHVVLQGVCTNAAFPETHAQIFPPYVAHTLVPSISTLMRIIEENCDSTVTIYQMPWAFEDGTTWITGYNHSYFDMQELIFENVLKFSNDLGFKISPVGWAWYRIMRDHPEIKLFQADFNHPSAKGAYLLACVVYVSIFNESITGASYLGSLNQEEALYLQEVASLTVLDNQHLWN